MKKFFKFLFYTIIIAFVLVQFYPKPAKNQTTAAEPNHISNKYPIPAAVDSILKTSCYDCHSNNTRYPWYSRVQPVAWWLGDHINEGKREINFSEFLSYRIAKQYKKLAEVEEQIKEDEMPLSSYTIIHTDGKLNAAKKDLLLSWTESIRDSIKANYPADSLLMPKRKS